MPGPSAGSGSKSTYGRSGSRARSRRPEGWHRLSAEWALRIVDTSPVCVGDLVVDVGAGTGALTAPLLAVGAHVIAVELNPRRATILNARFADRLTVVKADIRGLRLPRRAFRVVASPPYAVSTDLLALLLSTDRLLSADLVLQRAAAQRFALSPPRRRHTRRYTVEVGMSVPRHAFTPPPRVDSVVLRVRRR